jgi:hypothetical protein
VWVYIAVRSLLLIKKKCNNKRSYVRDHPTKILSYLESKEIPILWKRPVRRSPMLSEIERFPILWKRSVKDHLLSRNRKIPYPMRKAVRCLLFILESWDSLSYERGSERLPTYFLFILESQMVLSYEMRSLNRSPYSIRVPRFWYYENQLLSTMS